VLLVGAGRSGAGCRVGCMMVTVLTLQLPFFMVVRTSGLCWFFSVTWWVFARSHGRPDVCIRKQIRHQTNPSNQAATLAGKQHENSSRSTNGQTNRLCHWATVLVSDKRCNRGCGPWETLLSDLSKVYTRGHSPSHLRVEDSKGSLPSRWVAHLSIAPRRFLTYT
jgi:hypothetical protein